MYTIFQGRGLHGLHKHAFSFSKIFIRVENEIITDLLYFTIRLYKLRPRAPAPDPGAMNFTILVEDFMDFITMHLVFLIYLYEQWLQ